MVSVPAGGSLMDSTETMDFFPAFHLEGFPNRDSTKYAEAYGIQSAHTLIRGTLRFKVQTRRRKTVSKRFWISRNMTLRCGSVPQGFSKAMSGFVRLGLIDSEPCSILNPTAAPVSWVRSRFSAFRL